VRSVYFWAHEAAGDGKGLDRCARGLHTEASFSSVNRGEKYCIRISVAFRLYLVKII
jgi:hypothetical protein